MIKGVSKKAIPYVLEDDRESPDKEQTVFWIKPKTGEDNNKTLARYGQASKETRKGREINVTKLNIADLEEFTSVVERVELYQFPEDSTVYKDFDNGVVNSTEDSSVLKEIARTLSADHLGEILEVSNNLSRLTAGAKKSSNS